MTGAKKPAYRRVLLKLSGEALMGGRSFGIDPDIVQAIAAEIRDVVKLGVQIGVVVGGGNIFRGVEGSARGMERTQADNMGMLATVINSLAIQKSELGLNPANDGKIVRINIPQLTEERRKELVKVVKKMAEEGKVKLRNIRRDANEELKKLKKDSDINEDDMFKYQADVQKVTDDYIEKTDKVLQAKEKEIMEI